MRPRVPETMLKKPKSVAQKQGARHIDGLNELRRDSVATKEEFDLARKARVLP